MEYTYIGIDAAVSDAAAKADGSLQYAADLQLPQMLHMKLLLSPVAHGIVRKIDTAAAAAMPGVRAILTWENTPAVRYNRGRVRATEKRPDQETLFTRHVRFVGDRIGAVVADTLEIAEQACRAIRLEIQPLDIVSTPEQAMQPQAASLHEEGNVIAPPPVEIGNYADASGTEFYHHSTAQRVCHTAMEPHCVVASYQPGRDRMHIWTPTQSVFGVRSAVATILQMSMSHIRVIKTPMGGSFGCKQEMILEPLAACAAKMLGSPVKLQLSRREVMLCTIVRHPLDGQVWAKFSADQKIQALRLHCVLDAGAYQTNTPAYAAAISAQMGRLYDIPNLSYQSCSVCTNNPVSGSYRGWGSPEAALVLENTINAAARKFGWDPIALRLANILPPHSRSRLNGCSLGDIRLRDVLETGRKRFGWQQRRARLAAQDRSGRYLRGIGMALGAHTSGYYPLKADWGAVNLKMEEDGSVHVNCSLHDHGCGTITAFTKIVAEILSMPPHMIDIPEADTAYNALDNGCYASRTIYVLGRAVQDAAQKLRNMLLQMASKLLHCEPEQLQLHQATASVIADASRQCSYAEIAAYAADCRCTPLFVTHHYIPNTNPSPAGAHFAEVEVDTWTGLCRVTSYLAVHDIGKAINPALCRGQVGSALQLGMGLVFCEQLQITPDGQPKNASLQRYAIARASELPEIDVVWIEHGDSDGPFGAKSIGEACYVPVAPALVAAVNDALQSELSELPLTPEKILQALQL